MRYKYFVSCTMIACAFIVFAQDAHSCSVPVFRYALERWKPDPYKGIYLYRGEIGEEDKGMLQQLKEASADDEAPLNLVIREVNTDTFGKEKLSTLFQGPIPEKLPRLVIWYPDQMGKKPPFLQEAITPSLVESLVQSPKRRQIAESLIGGASVIWVYVPSGNETKDENALKLIRQELDASLEIYAKAPFTIISGAERKRLSYGFPILTLSRDDPAEQIFLETLMRSEPDLYEHTDEPMVFPVFGRGRVLGCLFGEYITPQRILETTAFLSGSCSCEVKELNPGMDLLVAAPWDLVVMNSFIEEEPLPELTGIMPGSDEPMTCERSTDNNLDTALSSDQVQRYEESTANNSDIPEDHNSGPIKIYAISLGGVSLIVVVSGFIVSRRRRNR